MRHRHETPSLPQSYVALYLFGFLRSCAIAPLQAPLRGIINIKFWRSVDALGKPLVSFLEAEGDVVAHVHRPYRQMFKCRP